MKALLRFCTLAASAVAGSGLMAPPASVADPAFVDPARSHAEDTLASARDRIRTIVADRLGFAMDSLTAETRFIEDLEIDSLDSIEVTMAVEEAFDIEITEAAIPTLLTIGDVVTYVKTATNAVR